MTIESLTDFVKSKMPEVVERDFTLRMLVKKDQQLDTLNFLSFRLSCTDDIHKKVNDGEFWPKGIMIGEFIERPRKTVSLNELAGPKNQ